MRARGTTQAPPGVLCRQGDPLMCLLRHALHELFPFTYYYLVADSIVGGTNIPIPPYLK